MDASYRGMPSANLIDEDVFAIVQGAADELSLFDKNTLDTLKPSTVRLIFKVIELAYGQVPVSVTESYNNTWKA